MNNIKILFVDDDPDFRAAHIPALKNLGAAVVEAESFADAEAKRGTGSFDLAIIDLMMEKPDSGFTLAYHIKKDTPATKVILVSEVNSTPGIHFGLDTPAERAWIKADCFLDKPIRFEQLADAIEKMFA